MSESRRFLYLFADGCGMGEDDTGMNPLARFGAGMPELPASPFLSGEGFETERSLLLPFSPLLRHPGLPQSATGQTALFTGIDPVPLVGRHISGFPTPKLEALIREHSLLKVLAERGLRVTSANAYSRDYFERVKRERWLKFSATTLAIAAAGVPFRMEEDLLARRAVFHDLTRKRLRRRFPDVPLLTPEEAATDLAAIVGEHDFTLFEYFLTDTAGHRESPEKKAQIAAEFERFFRILVQHLNGMGGTLLLTSDHGNLEDASVRTHTRNRVPCLVVGGGDGRDLFRTEGRGIEEIRNAVLDWFSASREDRLS